MAQVSKGGLSGSPGNNRGIKIVATATPGTLVHTCVTTVSTAGNFDELWLYVYNSHTADVTVTVELGGTTAPDDNIVVTVPFKQGRFLLVDGHPLQGGVAVRVFASVANVVVATGFVNVVQA